MLDGFQQLADLVVGQSIGEPLLPRLANLFFPNKSQSRFSVWQ
jgi:hypothetical protein